LGGIAITDIKEDLLYTKTHEWIRVQEDEVTVGVTDYAQEQLTDIVFVEDLPEIGDEVEAGDAICVLNSVKAASETYTPIGGEVLEVNAALEDEPELINTSPYEDGWLLKLKVSDVDTSEFMTSEAYREFLETVDK